MSKMLLYLVGGNGGEPFSLTGKKNGENGLQRMWVWVGPSAVKAVRIWLSDGQNETYGSPEGEYKEYVFQPGERITSLSLWGNGIGTRLGGIKFKTNHQNEFFVKMTSWGLQTEYPIDVGSGFCLGIEGRSGLEIDRMGFLFLNTIRSVVLTNVKYPTIEQVIPQVTPEEIKAVTYKNKSSVSQKQAVEISEKITITNLWSMTDNISASFSVEVTAGIPGIGETSTGFTATIEKENSYSREQTSEKTSKFSTQIEVPPKKKVDVKITIGRCSFDLPYTGTVKMSCNNGKVFCFHTKGHYKGVTYSRMNSEIKESDLLMSRFNTYCIFIKLPTTV